MLRLWENQHKYNRILGELSVLWLQSPDTGRKIHKINFGEVTLVMEGEGGAGSWTNGDRKVAGCRPLQIQQHPTILMPSVIYACIPILSHWNLFSLPNR